MDDRAVLGVELGSVTEVFVHDRISVIDMLGAEDMTKLVNQGRSRRTPVRVWPAVVKHRGNRHDYIIPQSLQCNCRCGRRAADRVVKIAADAFGCEKRRSNRTAVVLLRETRSVLSLASRSGVEGMRSFSGHGETLWVTAEYQTRSRNSPRRLRSARATSWSQLGLRARKETSASDFDAHESLRRTSDREPNTRQTTAR